MKFLRMWAVPAHALSSHGRAAVSGYMARSAMRLHSKKAGQGADFSVRDLSGSSFPLNELPSEQESLL